jgi:hypothetical protein
MKRHAKVAPLRSGGMLLVIRYREDGEYDYYTNHWFKFMARRAVRIYEKSGRIVGLRG